MKHFALLASLTFAASATPAGLNDLVGDWAGKTDGPLLPTEVRLSVRKEGTLFVIEIERSELLGTTLDKIYVDGPLALVSSSAVPAPRRDRVTQSGHGAVFESDPWEIGTEHPLHHVFSLETGYYEPPVQARIYINAPVYRPNPNVVTYKWSGTLAGQNLGERTAVLYRKPS